MTGSCCEPEVLPLPPALLLLYDVTNKASFDNIQVSGFPLGVVGAQAT